MSEDGHEPGLRPINPAALGAPRGYSNGMLAPPGARLLFVAGQIGWNEDQQLVGDGFAEQFAGALANVVAVVREAGGAPEHLARLTIYVVDRREYLATLEEIGARCGDGEETHDARSACIGRSDC